MFPFNQTRVSDTSEMYEIMRFFFDPKKPAKRKASNLTLEQAKRWCADPSTRKDGVYFDGYRRQ